MKVKGVDQLPPKTYRNPSSIIPSKWHNKCPLRPSKSALISRQINWKCIAGRTMVPLLLNAPPIRRSSIKCRYGCGEKHLPYSFTLDDGKYYAKCTLKNINWLRLTELRQSLSSYTTKTLIIDTAKETSTFVNIMKKSWNKNDTIFCELCCTMVKLLHNRLPIQAFRR